MAAVSRGLSRDCPDVRGTVQRESREREGERSSSRHRPILPSCAGRNARMEGRRGKKKELAGTAIGRYQPFPILGRQSPAGRGGRKGKERAPGRRSHNPPAVLRGPEKEGKRRGGGGGERGGKKGTLTHRPRVVSHCLDTRIRASRPFDQAARGRGRRGWKEKEKEDAPVPSPHDQRLFAMT